MVLSDSLKLSSEVSQNFLLLPTPGSNRSQLSLTEYSNWLYLYHFPLEKEISRDVLRAQKPSWNKAYFVEVMIFEWQGLSIWMSIHHKGSRGDRKIACLSPCLLFHTAVNHPWLPLRFHGAILSSSPDYASCTILTECLPCCNSLTPLGSSQFDVTLHQQSCGGHWQQKLVPSSTGLVDWML